MTKDLTDSERALIREIAFEVSDIILERHIASCPIAKRVSRVYWLAIGVALGAGITGLGSGLTIAKLLSTL